MRRRTLATGLVVALLAGGSAAQADPPPEERAEPITVEAADCATDRRVEPELRVPSRDPGVVLGATYFHPDWTPTAPPAQKAQLPARPVVAMTHGFAEGRRTENNTNATNRSQRRVCELLAWGYAVVTYDQRGANDSNSDLDIAHPDGTVRDVQGLLDRIATLPGVRLDAPGDARVGLYGGSLAAGVALMAASFDRRPDAVVAVNMWSDLAEALAPGGVPRRGWISLLAASGPPGYLVPGSDGGVPRADAVGGASPLMTTMAAEAAAPGTLSPATLAALAPRWPRHIAAGGTVTVGGRTFADVPGIAAPTLLAQSVNDTLFTASQGERLAEVLEARGVPVSTFTWCNAEDHSGSHTPLIHQGRIACRSGDGRELRVDAGPPRSPQLVRLNTTTKAWLDRWLGREGVQLGPDRQVQLQDGHWLSGRQLGAGPDLTVSVERDVVHTGVPTSGQAVGPTPPGCGPTGVQTAGTAFGSASVCPPDAEKGWTEVPSLAPDALVVGEPRLTGSVTVTAPDTRLFFSLVDLDPVTRTAEVVDDQVQAIRVYAPTASVAAPFDAVFSLRLPYVAWERSNGRQLYVAVSASSADHSESRVPSTARVRAQLVLPVLAAGAHDGKRDD